MEKSNDIKIISDRLEPIDPTGDVHVLIQELDSYMKKYSAKGYFDFFIDEDGYNDSYSYFIFCGKRQETPKEYEARKEKERRSKENEIFKKKKREEQERKEYERLKKKFDKGK